MKVMKEETMTHRENPSILITGATGHVGGALLAQLAARGLPVRALTRRPENIAPHPLVQVARGDFTDEASLDAALPQFITQGLQVSFYFGGTSLLIVVGVAMDTVQQVESQLIMRHYDGFLKKGRIRGRRG